MGRHLWPTLQLKQNSSITLQKQLLKESAIQMGGQTVTPVKITGTWE